MKRKIEGSEYADTELAYSVCSHLQKILTCLEKNGAEFDKAKNLHTDKSGGHSLKLDSKVDFELIKNEFEIPYFIEFSPDYKSVICRRCWCDIEGK